MGAERWTGPFALEFCTDFSSFNLELEFGAGKPGVHFPSSSYKQSDFPLSLGLQSFHLDCHFSEGNKYRTCFRGSIALLGFFGLSGTQG